MSSRTSSRSTNEAAYLLQKVFRTAIGTNNVDCCARVCHSSTALALSTATGTGAASASYADIERAATIIVAGANPTEAHPVLGLPTVSRVTPDEHALKTVVYLLVATLVVLTGLFTRPGAYTRVLAEFTVIGAQFRQGGVIGGAQAFGIAHRL